MCGHVLHVCAKQFGPKITDSPQPAQTSTHSSLSPSIRWVVDYSLFDSVVEPYRQMLMRFCALKQFRLSFGCENDGQVVLLYLFVSTTINNSIRAQAALDGTLARIFWFNQHLECNPQTQWSHQTEFTKEMPARAEKSNSITACLLLRSSPNAGQVASLWDWDRDREYQARSRGVLLVCGVRATAYVCSQHKTCDVLRAMY